MRHHQPKSESENTYLTVVLPRIAEHGSLTGKSVHECARLESRGGAAPVKVVVACAILICFTVDLPHDFTEFVRNLRILLRQVSTIQEVVAQCGCVSEALETGAHEARVAEVCKPGKE